MKFLQRIAKFLSYSPFEAANPSIRRSHVPGAGPTDARKELTPHARRELVRKSRYLMKNSGFAREVVGDMAIYSTGDGIRPQAQSEDPQWNRQAEAYFARWCTHPESIRRLIREKQIKSLRGFRPFRITYDEIRRYETLLIGKSIEGPPVAETMRRKRPVE